MDEWMPNYNRYIDPLYKRERERERDGRISNHYIRYFHCIRETERKRERWRDEWIAFNLINP